MSAPSTILAQVARKDVSKERLAAKLVRRPAALLEVIQGQFADRTPIKYGCAKVVRLLSEQQPCALYPYIEIFIEMLDHPNNIMKWQAIHVIGNLAAVDTEGQIDRTLNDYLLPIEGPVLITAANVIGGAANIAVAKPRLAARIARAILKVESAEYQTPECRNVAAGVAIEAFGRFMQHVDLKRPIVAFVRRMLDNPRPGTRKKAERFLKRWA